MNNFDIYQDGKPLDIEPVAIIAIIKPESVKHGTQFGIYILESPEILNDRFWIDLPENLSAVIGPLLEARRLAKNKDIT